MTQKFITTIIVLFCLIVVMGILCLPVSYGGDTYYNTYSYQCDIAGDGECTWVMTDTAEEDQECPVVWNTFSEGGGLFLIHNVQLKTATGLTLQLNTVVLMYDPLTGLFEVLVVE